MEIPDDEFNLLYGAANDGDDLIDFGDSPDAGNFYGFGQGGNDKIFGGLVASQQLYGGDGDDKIWAINPGQSNAGNDSYLYGGDDDDIIYGSDG